jgi:hypothetical protein
MAVDDSCGAPVQEATPANYDTRGQVVLAGKVTGADGPVGGAFVRLLDGGGDFTGEVVSSADGDFRFYAAPGDWTVRAQPPAVGRPAHPQRHGQPARGAGPQRGLPRAAADGRCLAR